VTAPKVGDMVAWADVPDGAMVRDAEGWHALRVRARGVFVGQPGEGWLSADPWSDAGRWHWSTAALATDGTRVTIVALDLTGQETADDLRRLAEVFEVREALLIMKVDALERLLPRRGRLVDDWLNELAPMLHALGWRHGMTAEDAARLLANCDAARRFAAAGK
jgi:hypothetical protein